MGGTETSGEWNMLRTPLMSNDGAARGAGGRVSVQAPL